MKAKAVESIADALLLFITELRKESRPPAKLSIPHRQWRVFNSRDHSFFFRRRETIDALIDFREKFAERKVWRDKWSDEYLKRAEGHLVGEAFDDSSKSAVLSATERAVERLEMDGPQLTVVLPIARLHLGKMRLAFPEIKLHTISTTRQQRIRSKFFKIIETTPHTESQKNELRKEVTELTGLLLNRACAEVIVRTDPDKAQAEAQRKVAPILDFLQLASLIFDPPHSDIRIQPGGDLLTKQPATLIIASDESSIHTRDRFLFTTRFEMTADRLAKLRKSGLRRLLNALAKPESKRTEFEKRMLTSMHWIADGSRQELLENKITSYITSIETFFSTDGSGNPLSRDLSEGCAIILASTLKRRVQLTDTIAELYKLRNKISHAGETVENNKAERQLREISLGLLASLGNMPKQFKSLKEFRNWLKERRLS